jgi:hypothetical protein
MLGAAVTGKFLLKGFDLLAQHVPTRVDDAGGRVDHGLAVLLVDGFKIKKRDHFHIKQNE